VINTERDDKQFRRGAILGFTMSEVLLLLIFLLMLLMVSQIKTKNEEIALNKGAATRLAATETELKGLRELRVQVEQSGGIKKFDVMKNYVHVQEQLIDKAAEVDALRAQIKEMEEASGDTRPLVEEAKRMSPDKPLQEAITHMVSVARTGDAIAKSGTPDEKKLAAAQTCVAELDNCKSQVNFINDKLNSKEGGRDKPPCWVDANNQIQYIFDATITDDGIILKDNKVKGKEEIQAKLPLKGISFGQPLKEGRFSSAVRPIFDWSEANNCRFYVRIFKRTSPALLASDYNPMFEAAINSFYFSLQR
jgi:hypothetical protein